MSVGKAILGLVTVGLFVASVPVAAVPGGAGVARAGTIPKVQPNLKPLDLSRAPTTEELMAAGQLGGQLYPTADIVVDDPAFPRHAARRAGKGSGTAVSERHKQINASFGAAIQKWNRHAYPEAVELFKKHVAEYPDSPWASESLLHLGCDAFYHGRLTEAEGYFQDIVRRNKGNAHQGAKVMTNKARLRLGVLKAARNNIEEASELFAQLIKESDDWRDRTYAAQWLRRLSAQKHAGTKPLACGSQALSRFLEASGLKEKADGLEASFPADRKGFSLGELVQMAATREVSLAALELKPEDLGRLELPALVHVAGRGPGDTGHYWVLEKRDGERLTLFDPQAKRYYRQSVAEFAREWSGAALVRDTRASLPGTRLAASELKEIAGGCCGVPKPEDDLGDREEWHEQSHWTAHYILGTFWANTFYRLTPDPPRDYGGHGGVRGAPGWWINPVNMNLFVKDTPLWYQPAVGPKVEISLSYNSQSAIAQNEPLGAKWQFNYGTYLVVDTGGEVTVFMPNGRRDVFSPDGSGGYLQPYQVYNKLVKLSENNFELRYPDGRVDHFAIPSGTSSLQPFLAESKDAYGNRLAFGYDGQVHLTTITDALGAVTTLTYNGDGLVTRVTEPTGRHADFEYGANRTLTKITDMGGYAFTFGYDSSVNLASLSNSQATWQFYLEPADGINNSADGYPPPGGVMWDNYRITVTDPLGGKEEFYYDGYTGSGWRVKPRDYVSYYPGYTGSDTPKITFGYGTTTSPRAAITSISTPTGEGYSYQYNTNGDRIADWDGSQYTYNGMGRITSIIDPRLQETTRTFAPNGVDLLTQTDAGATVKFAYNANHGITSVTDELNKVTSFSYNSLGQLTSSTDPLGTVTNITYGTDHRPSQLTVGGVTTRSWSYDASGRIQSYTGPDGVTLSYDYNLLDDPVKITYPDATFVAIGYSSVVPHLVTTVTNRAGKTTGYGYDKLNRLVSTTTPDGGTVTYGRDLNGNLTSITDAKGNVTLIGYDLSDRPNQESYPDGTTLGRSFRKADLLDSITLPNGNLLQFSYDDSMNLAGLTGAGSFGYDALNRRSSMTDNRGTTNYGYDAASRLTSVSDPAGGPTVTLSYDAAGRRTGISVGSRQINYGFDALGRVTGVSEGTRTYTLGYAAANPLPQSILRPSGSSTSILRDVLNRPQQVVNKKSTNSVIDEFDYTYAAGWNLPASESVTGGAPQATLSSAAQIYGYDAANRLVSATSPDRTFTRDQAGNLTQGYTPDGFPFSAAYDDLNRLTSLEYTDGGSVVHHNDYAYDADGRIVSTTETVGGTVTRAASFTQLGDMLLQERDGSGTAVRDYTWNAGDRLTLLGLSQGGVNYDFLHDGQGRVTALIDPSQATVAGYSYDPFGAPSASGTVDQPFRFANREFDRSFGLYRVGGQGFLLPNPGYQLAGRLLLTNDRSRTGRNYDPFSTLMGTHTMIPASHL